LYDKIEAFWSTITILVKHPVGRSTEAGWQP